MKVITEEDARFVCNVINEIDGIISNVLKNHLIDLIESNIKEIDTLTVSTLRPMSDLLIKKDYAMNVLGIIGNEYFMKIRQSSDDEVYCVDTAKFLPASQFIGWIPVPTYKPELTGDGE